MGYPKARETPYPSGSHEQPVEASLYLKRLTVCTSSMTRLRMNRPGILAPLFGLALGLAGCSTADNGGPDDGSGGSSDGAGGAGVGTGGAAGPGAGGSANGSGGAQFGAGGSLGTGGG